MKISLAWIFDYFKEDFQGVDVKKIVDLFNRKTAEIEHFEHYKLDLSSFFIVSIERKEKDIVVHCEELGEDYTLPTRKDGIEGKYYLAKRNGKDIAWATLVDFNLEKDGLIPALQVSKDQVAGSWRFEVELEDYILDVDNKSINHRPDLWGHRGIAREIAAVMGQSLKNFSEFYIDQKIEHFDEKSKESSDRFAIEIKDSKKCFRFAGLKCDNVQYQDSDIHMAFRLIRLGIRPINAVVDLTNYVMLDIGHPMHVFNADAFAKQEVIIRPAKAKEKLQLLDGSEIEMRKEDLVIADHEKPVSLAGIYGGLGSGYTPETKTLFLEAAGFDPTCIRKTAQHFKVRTEASMRFEKHLDPMQNVIVLQRFLFLAQKLGVLGVVSSPIVSVGEVVKPRVIKVDHAAIERALGIELDSDYVVKTLELLDFGVKIEKNEYSVIVPTLRMTKDISIVEDVIEEVGRLYGFDALPHELPSREMKPFDVSVVQNIRKIKQFCAYSLKMHEVRDYLFYDESFLRELAPWIYDDEKVVKVQNPVSENWKVMVQSLIPHLLKHVINNQREHNQIRFFEWNNVWEKNKKDIVEQTVLSGVFYHAQGIDFYNAQADLQGLFDALHLSVSWKKDTSMPAWFDVHRSGVLYVGGQSIGFAGMLNKGFCKALSDVDLFMFELDARFLSEYERDVVQYQPWSKYQDVKQDISLFVPLSLSVDEVLETVRAASKLIRNPELIDFYEQEKWLDKRSITVRYTISSEEKTLEKSEIDTVVAQVTKAVEAKKAVVR